jgi:hypothetical protein
MKKLLLLPALCFCAASSWAGTLTTPSFIVDIKVQCAEGNVSCDKVDYVGKSRKTGKSIALHGKTMHTLCADGVTPCRFLGYEFWNGKINYRVGEDGTLLVTQGRKVLVSEKGEWKW